MKKHNVKNNDNVKKRWGASPRFNLLITLLIIFFVQIGYSLFHYISIIKRPVLIRGIERKGINPKKLSVYGTYLYITNIDGKFLRQVDKVTGDIKWELKGEGLVDAIADEEGKVYVLFSGPTKLSVYHEKEKIKEIMLPEVENPLNMETDMAGNIYITDRNKNKIITYSSAGNYMGSIEIKPGENPGFAGRISVDYGSIFVVAKPGIVREYDLVNKKWIKKQKIPYLTKGEKWYAQTEVKKAVNGDYYVSDPAASRMLVFNKDWRIKGVFYQNRDKTQRFISCGPIDTDNKRIYINNYLIFVFEFL